LFLALGPQSLLKWSAVHVMESSRGKVGQLVPTSEQPVINPARSLTSTDEDVTGHAVGPGGLVAGGLPTPSALTAQESNQGRCGTLGLGQGHQDQLGEGDQLIQ
jgi:hypothetical protein